MQESGYVVKWGKGGAVIGGMRNFRELRVHRNALEIAMRLFEGK